MSINKVEAIKKTQLFRKLEIKYLEALSERAFEKRYKRGEVIFFGGAQAKGLFVVAKGSVRAVRINPEGREQVIHVERTGSTIAEIPVFDGGLYPSTVIANEDSTLLYIEKNDVLNLCLQHPQIAISALSVISKRLRQCAETIEFLSLREVGQRIARLLIQQAKLKEEFSQHSPSFELGLTNHQIASQVGSVREVVSRAMSRLQHDGLIKVEGRTVTIPDLQRLIEYADIEGY
ncbi:MAG: Crp/Fnr family transcriptional regulator [Blastocatellia bacterium]|nr:Crp/Fnr family transcriptional regulator [Blastocatellia bacterium]